MMSGIRNRLIAGGASLTLVAAGSLLYHFEGDKQPYIDPVGVLTVCVGSTSNVELGKFYSEQECTQRLIDDLRTAEKAVNRCTPKLPETMKPALVSFVFNVGSGNYCSSTLAKMANAGQYVAACQQLYRWTYASGRVLPGLVKRRDAEARACLEGVPRV